MKCPDLDALQVPWTEPSGQSLEVQTSHLVGRHGDATSGSAEPLSHVIGIVREHRAAALKERSNPVPHSGELISEIQVAEDQLDRPGMEPPWCRRTVKTLAASMVRCSPDVFESRPADCAEPEREPKEDSRDANSYSCRQRVLRRDPVLHCGGQFSLCDQSVTGVTYYLMGWSTLS